MCVVVVGTVIIDGTRALVMLTRKEDALEPEVLGGRESVAGFLG